MNDFNRTPEAKKVFQEKRKPKGPIRFNIQLNEEQKRAKEQILYNTVTVLKGKAFDVAIDLRKGSKTFGQYVSIILSGKQNVSFYIPEGFAHGFCALENNTIMHYKCTNYRDEKSELGIIWNDPKLNIKWPIKKPIVSKRDKKNLNLEHFFLNKI